MASERQYFGQIFYCDFNSYCRRTELFFSRCKNCTTPFSFIIDRFVLIQRSMTTSEQRYSKGQNLLKRKVKDTDSVDRKNPYAPTDSFDEVLGHGMTQSELLKHTRAQKSSHQN